LVENAALCARRGAIGITCAAALAPADALTAPLPAAPGYGRRSPPPARVLPGHLSLVTVMLSIGVERRRPPARPALL